MLLDLEKLYEDSFDKLPQEAKVYLEKLNNNNLTGDEVNSFYKLLLEIGRSSLIGHRGLLHLSALVDIIIKDKEALEFFSQEHSSDEVKTYFYDKVKEIY